MNQRKLINVAMRVDLNRKRRVRPKKKWGDMNKSDMNTNLFMDYMGGYVK